MHAVTKVTNCVSQNYKCSYKNLRNCQIVASNWPDWKFDQNGRFLKRSFARYSGLQMFYNITCIRVFLELNFIKARDFGEHNGWIRERYTWAWDFEMWTFSISFNFLTRYLSENFGSSLAWKCANTDFNCSSNSVWRLLKIPFYEFSRLRETDQFYDIIREIFQVKVQVKPSSSRIRRFTVVEMTGFPSKNSLQEQFSFVFNYIHWNIWTWPFDPRMTWT